jgi:hypothetical protein
MSPVYTTTWGDAVTGDNEFLWNDGGTDRHAWFINTGADSYHNDFYERPTVQTYDYRTVKTIVGTDSELVGNGVGHTYSDTGTSGPSYFGYLDIVKGKFGFDNQFMYFYTELFSDKKVSNDGTAISDFGESSRYNIRISEDPYAHNGILLQATDGTFLTGDWQTEKMLGHYDEYGSVGGPGGVSTPDEGLGAEPGYETEVAADGKAKGTDTEILFGRRITSLDGRPVVEIAFDYVTYNDLFGNFQIDPSELMYLDFEATRGLKGISNYSWNDQYSFFEAGTPYDPLNQPQNIYELDTLQTTIPDPATVCLLGLGALVLLRKRKV